LFCVVTSGKKRPHKRSDNRWEDKGILREIDFEDVNWMELIWDQVWWYANSMEYI
jgi:hypothetical protein